MWNNTGFGGEDAAADGGGFMNSSVMDSPAPGGAKKRRAESVIPMTVSMVINNKEDPMVYYDREVHMAALVGIIRSVELSSTKVSYVLDDHTGCINIIKYADGDNDESPEDALTEGVYAKVYGPIRTHDGKKHILGFSVNQITDTNMITAHLLEIVHTNLKFKQLNNASSMDDSNRTVLPNSTVMSTASNVGSSLGSREKDLVYEAIKSRRSEAGTSRSAIKSILEGKLSAAKVEEVIADLSADGMIYTTHDDDHFQIIDG